MSRAEKCFVLIYTLNLPSFFDFVIYIIMYIIYLPLLLKMILMFVSRNPVRKKTALIQFMFIAAVIV